MAVGWDVGGRWPGSANATPLKSRSEGDVPSSHQSWALKVISGAYGRADKSVRATGTKEKATLLSQRGLYLCRQRPTLPHTFACSTIGPAGLNFRVRDGNGWNPRGKITDNLMQL